MPSLGAGGGTKAGGRPRMHPTTRRRSAPTQRPPGGLHCAVSRVQPAASSASRVCGQPTRLASAPLQLTLARSVG